MNGLIGAAIGAVDRPRPVPHRDRMDGRSPRRVARHDGGTERLMIRIGLAVGATTVGYLITGWLARRSWSASPGISLRRRWTKGQPGCQYRSH